MSQTISPVLSHSVYGTLLEQSKEANTADNPGHQPRETSYRGQPIQMRNLYEIHFKYCYQIKLEKKKVHAVMSL